MYYVDTKTGTVTFIRKKEHKREVAILKATRKSLLKPFNIKRRKK